MNTLSQPSRDEVAKLPPAHEGMEYLKCSGCGDILLRTEGCRASECSHCASKWAMNRAPTENIRAECILKSANAKLPRRIRGSDAAYDLYTPESHVIAAHTTLLIDIGLAIVVPPGYYYTIEGRSGLFKHSVVPHTGIIDATYSDSLRVALHNGSNHEYKIEAGDRIAQIIIHRQLGCDFVVVDEVSDEYKGRGLAGFSSSGK